MRLRQFSRSLRDLRNGLRKHADARAVRECGHGELSGLVQIGVTADGRAEVRGTLSCKRAWVCPVCAWRVQVERAKEVRQAIQWYRAPDGGAGEVYLLTLTVRHAMGDDLRTLRKGIMRAWQSVQQSAWWRKHLRGGYRCTGSIRAIETTHGANGYHPHLHLALCVERGAWTDREMSGVRTMLGGLWRLAVVRRLGRKHIPTLARGADLRVMEKDDYITKLAFEVTTTAAKNARGRNRAAFEIARDLVDHGRARDARLWREWGRGMKGARAIGWSRGLRARVGLGAELTDEQLIAQAEAAEIAESAREGRVVVTIEGALWRKLVKRGRVEGLLRCIEDGGDWEAYLSTATRGA